MSRTSVQIQEDSSGLYYYVAKPSYTARTHSHTDCSILESKSQEFREGEFVDFFPFEAKSLQQAGCKIDEKSYQVKITSQGRLIVRQKFIRGKDEYAVFTLTISYNSDTSQFQINDAILCGNFELATDKLEKNYRKCLINKQSMRYFAMAEFWRCLFDGKEIVSKEYGWTNWDRVYSGYGIDASQFKEDVSLQNEFLDHFPIHSYMLKHGIPFAPVDRLKKEICRIVARHDKGMDSALLLEIASETELFFYQFAKNEHEKVQKNPIVQSYFEDLDEFLNTHGRSIEKYADSAIHGYKHCLYEQLKTNGDPNIDYILEVTNSLRNKSKADLIQDQGYLYIDSMIDVISGKNNNYFDEDYQLFYQTHQPLINEWGVKFYSRIFDRLSHWSASSNKLNNLFEVLKLARFLYVNGLYSKSKEIKELLNKLFDSDIPREVLSLSNQDRKQILKYLDDLIELAVGSEFQIKAQNLRAIVYLNLPVDDPLSSRVEIDYYREVDEKPVVIFLEKILSTDLFPVKSDDLKTQMHNYMRALLDRYFQLPLSGYSLEQKRWLTIKMFEAKVAFLRNDFDRIKLCLKEFDVHFQKFAHADYSAITYHAAQELEKIIIQKNDLIRKASLKLDHAGKTYSKKEFSFLQTCLSDFEHDYAELLGTHQRAKTINPRQSLGQKNVSIQRAKKIAKKAQKVLENYSQLVRILSNPPWASLNKILIKAKKSLQYSDDILIDDCIHQMNTYSRGYFLASSRVKNLKIEEGELQKVFVAIIKGLENEVSQKYLSLCAEMLDDTCDYILTANSRSLERLMRNTHLICHRSGGELFGGFSFMVGSGFALTGTILIAAVTISTFGIGSLIGGLIVMCIGYYLKKKNENELRKAVNKLPKVVKPNSKQVTPYLAESITMPEVEKFTTKLALETTIARYLKNPTVENRELLNDAMCDLERNCNRNEILEKLMYHVQSMKLTNVHLLYLDVLLFENPRSSFVNSEGLASIQQLYQIVKNKYSDWPDFSSLRHERRCSAFCKIITQSKINLTLEAKNTLNLWIDYQSDGFLTREEKYELRRFLNKIFLQTKHAPTHKINSIPIKRSQENKLSLKVNVFGEKAKKEDRKGIQSPIERASRRRNSLAMEGGSKVIEEDRSIISNGL